MHSDIIRNILSHSNENRRKDFSINELEQDQFKQLISEHNIWGQLDTNLDFVTQKKKENQLSNLFLHSQYEKFCSLLNDKGFHKVIPLKGMSLLQQIYPQWTHRRLSDIDVLIATDKKNILHKTLIEAGYDTLDEIKWHANDHKITYIKTHDFMDITIEIHFKLYNHLNYQPKFKTIAGNIYLSLEDELLYLCYHLAEQHNFLKLFWLKDIALFINKYDDNICWDTFHKIAKKLSIERSTQSSLRLCHKYLNVTARHTKENILAKRLLNWEFLCFPYKSKFKYFLIKYYLKGPRAFSYLIYWLKAYKFN